MSVYNLCSSLGSCPPQYRDDNRPQRADIRALVGALRSNPVLAAQQALDSVPQTGSSSESQAQSANEAHTASQSSGALSQLARDLSALGNALQSGDLTAAQQAFATMQQDLHTVRRGWGGWAIGRPHHRHHHHGHHDHRFGGRTDGVNAGLATNISPTSAETTGIADAGGGSSSATQPATSRTSITAVSVSVSIDILTIQAAAA